ncbi:helix-turn-helix domain-containing protein [Microbacterium sp. NPDC089695]|uniref:helix-turn-helix domain-containing protein n=1 Tax=Microbacterium sp. NPDC089695 TaxID=3364198 RepID=UPI0037F3ABCE
MKLQDVVEELAVELGRSVVINDLEFKPLAASAQGDDVDPIRVNSLLQRSTPSAAVDYLRELDLENLRGSRTIDLSRFDALERLVTPIRADGRTVAYLWLITGDRPHLTHAQLDALDAAVAMAAAELGATGGPTATDRLLAELFSPMRAARLTALQDAVKQRVLPSVDAYSVVAVDAALDDTAFEIRRGPLQRSINAPGARPVHVAAMHLGRALIVASHTADNDVFVRVREGFRRSGVEVAGVGCSGGADEDDPLAVAERAIDAARYSAALPEHPGVRYEDIGALALVNPESVSPRRIAGISAAARVLLGPGMDTARQTVLAFLEAAGDVRRACDALHLHRTTLYYRLDRLDPVVRAALDDGWGRTSLHVALRLAALRDEDA